MACANRGIDCRLRAIPQPKGAAMRTWEILRRAAGLIGMVGLVACSSPGATERIGSASEPSQCGPTDDSQPVESYNGSLGVSTAFVARHERRVGFLTGVGCSGTLISDDLFLSAGHCGWANNQTVQFDFQNTASGTARTPDSVTVSGVVESQNDANFDYAIVRLNGSPSREFGH